jgi:hypothetical protein
VNLLRLPLLIFSRLSRPLPPSQNQSEMAVTAPALSSACPPILSPKQQQDSSEVATLLPSNIPECAAFPTAIRLVQDADKLSVRLQRCSRDLRCASSFQFSLLLMTKRRRTLKRAGGWTERPAAEQGKDARVEQRKLAKSCLCVFQANPVFSPFPLTFSSPSSRPLATGYRIRPCRFRPRLCWLPQSRRLRDRAKRP